MDENISNSPNTKHRLVNQYNDLYDIENIDSLFITCDNKIELFSDLYEIKDVIGSGAFAIVVSAIERKSREISAMKV